MRLLLTLLIALSVAAAMAGGAYASLFFLFSPTRVAPGERAVIRTGGTPASFHVRDRVRPFQAPITVYLIPDAVAASVRSRTDSRLILIGTLVPDKNGYGLLTFRVPRLDTGTYAAAAWCPGCAAFSFGRTFFTYPDDPQIVPRYRALMLLRIEGSGSAFRCWWAVGAVAFLVVSSGALFVRRRALGSDRRSVPD